MSQTELQGGVGAHAQAHDMGAIDIESIEDREDVVGGELIAVELGRIGHVRGRITAGIEGNATVLAREPPNLLLPLAQVGAKLVYEHDRTAAARFFIVEAGTLRIYVWHGRLRCMPSGMPNYVSGMPDQLLSIILMHLDIPIKFFRRRGRP